MGLVLPLLLLAVSVKSDQTPLRNGCGTDAQTIALMPAGASVTIRYALAGEAVPCFKIAVTSNGKAVEGYLPASALEDLEDFARGVREAAWVDVSQMIAAAQSRASLSSSSAGTGGAVLINAAAALIESSQPTKALELLEPQLRTGKDPNLLALAGLAALRSDDSAKALAYWRASLDLHPDPDLEALYRRVDREIKTDRSSEKLYGWHVVLRYEPGAVTVDTARGMVTVLDQELARVASELGCSAQERIVAIAQSREAYRKTTDSAEWSGGQFDGRIRVPVFDGQGVNASMQRTLAHEMTHACLSMLGHWPSWLQEGLAQKISGDRVPPALRQKLTLWAREGKLPRLENLRQDWSRLDTEHAVAAYGLSLAAVEIVYESYGAEGVRNLLHNADRITALAAELDRRLGL